MTDEPRKLTPVEEARLRDLLSRAEAYLTSAEVKWLEAEQKKLTKQELKAAEKLADLQAALDRITTRLETLCKERSFAGRGNFEASKFLATLIEAHREHLAAYAADDTITPLSLIEYIKKTAAASHPYLFSMNLTPDECAAVAAAETSAKKNRAFSNHRSKK